MKRFLVILGLVLMLLSGCGDSKSGGSDKAKDMDKAIETSDTDYKFTYYGKDNPEIKYNIDDCVKLGDYKNLVIETDAKESVTNKDVTDYIIKSLSKSPIIEDLDRKTVRKNDYLKVTKTGETEQELFNVGESGEDNIKILVGSKVGDTVTTQSLDDKSKTYTFTINKVVKITPVTSLNQLDTEYLKKNTPCDNLKDLKSFVRRYLEANERNKLSVSCSDALIKACDVTLPDGYLEWYVLKTMSDVDYQAYLQGVSNLDVFISSNFGMTADAYKKQLEANSEEYLKQLLICEAIIGKEDLQFDEDEYAEYLDFMCCIGGFKDVDTMLKSYSDESILKGEYEKTYMPLNFVLKNAKVEYVGG